MSDEMPDPMEALAERAARIIHRFDCADSDCKLIFDDDTATARAVLTDLASTGNLLASPDDLRGSVGVVLGQLRATRSETERLVAENRALVRDAGNGLASLRRADGIERRQLQAERDRLSAALVKALEHLDTYAPGAADLIRKSAGLTP